MSNQYEIKKSNKVRQLKKKASYDKKLKRGIKSLKTLNSLQNKIF